MKKLLIVLPTYNEEVVIEKNTLQVYLFCQEKFKNYDWQILIADNGSTDQTPIIAKNLSEKDEKIKFFHLNKKGRGYALKKAWSLEYPVDFYAYMDVDLSSDLNALPLLIKSIELEAFDLATGSRLKIGHQTKRSLSREILSRGYNLLLKIFFKPSFQDAQCGFKVVTKKVVEKIIPQIKNNNWFFDTEMFILAEKSGYKIKEIPIEWLETRAPQRKSTVKILATVWEDIKGMIELKKRLKNFK